MQNNGWLYNLREIAAIAFTPVVSTILCVLIYIFAYGNWSSDMERTRLELLGGIAIAVTALVALGALWLQRIQITSFKMVNDKLGSIELDLTNRLTALHVEVAADKPRSPLE